MKLKCQVGEYDSCATCKHDRDSAENYECCHGCVWVKCDGYHCGECHWEPADEH